MRQTARNIQELIIFFKEYWYFSFIYIWWLATTILYFKETKPWKRKEIPFNWGAYLIVVVVLFGLFFGNRAAFNTFFHGLWGIILTPVTFILELVVGILGFILNIIIPKSGTPVLIQIIQFIVMIAVLICLVIAVFWGVIIAGGIYILWWLIKDLIKKWFTWFKYQYSIPLMALIFYPAANITFNFLFEVLTRHPLEGSLTVKASRKIWLLVIGLLILLTGILGKILV